MSIYRDRIRKFEKLDDQGNPLDDQGERILTCIERVTDGGRLVSSHSCDRKLKGDPEYPYLCGLHVAAARRAVAKSQARAELKEAREGALDEFRARVEEFNQRYDVKAVAKVLMPTAGPGAHILQANGDVIISLDQLEALIARLTGTPGCDHSEMLTNTGQVCSCGKFVG